MKTLVGTLAAPFPYFGGKARACRTVWAALGDPVNYVEPFAGSAAMLLGRPVIGKVETINDADGFVANFWRAVSRDAAAVVQHVDWPVNEIDLFARHGWLVRAAKGLRQRLEADPDYYDVRMAGWWCWGACNWIGDGWCRGDGLWVSDGEQVMNIRKLPHLGEAGKGVNRRLPHLGDGVNARRAVLQAWFDELMNRLRHVRVTAGDWQRVLGPSVTTRHGITGIFFDPPYTKGAMDYAVGGVGGELAQQVRAWCAEHGHDPNLRIVLCGHAGEHDSLLQHGWDFRHWKAGSGYARTEQSCANYQSETVWCSPHCLPKRQPQAVLFAG